MRKQDFYGLPRSLQDRFIESSQAVAAPTPLAAAPVGERRSLIWGAICVLTGLIWAGFISLGIGDLRSPFALTSIVHKLIHIGFAGVVVACAARAYSLSWAAKRIPYGSGDYLFPCGVISARESKIVEYDARQVSSVAQAGASVKVSFSGGPSFTFPTQSPEVAQRTVEGFQQQAEKWKEVADGQPLPRARLNPLTESGVPNPLAPTQPHQRPRLIPLPVLVVIVSVLALVFGLGAALWRDSLSRKALYKAATEENTVEAYRAYLARGGEREEVSTLLLPRAELQDVVKKGTVEAIMAFQKVNPKSKITGEVQIALREALLKELQKAKEKGTLSAIEELPKKFSSHQLIQPEINAARREVFARAMANFQEQAADKDEQLISFVQQLLTYAEKNGPNVQLRFAQDFPQDPKMLDQIVSKSKKYYMGNKSLPTQYFLGDEARRREKEFLLQIQKRLQAAFPKDILEFKLGPPPKKENEELPQIEVPAITFTHRERLSGGFVGGKPKAMYLGAALLMTADAEIPGQDISLEFKWNAWRSPQFSILSDEKMDIPDVYEDMMGGAFDKFAEIYLGRWFKEP